ncbi:hypothetical protein [Rhizobium sp. 22-785-1]
MGSEVGGISILSTYFAPLVGSVAAHIDAILPGPEQAQLMGQSFSQRNQLARQYLITDTDIHIPNIERIVVEKPLSGQLTLEILRRQRDFFKHNANPTPIIVCDTDLLFFKSVSHLFDMNFDIAITRRHGNRTMPFNSGIFFVNNRTPNAGYRFWTLQVQTIERCFMNDAGWYGDQLVLTKIITDLATPVGKDMYEVDGLKILVLDGDQYNFSPNREHSYLFLRPNVHVYHFKGRSREFMRYFYRFYISSEERDIFTPLKILFHSIRLELSRKKLKGLYLQARERLSPAAT